MEKLRKITALFLAAALLLPLLPGAAWATEVTEETFVVEAAAEETAMDEETTDEEVADEAAAEEAATEENTDEAQETSPESSVSGETEDDEASETEETDEETLADSIYSALFGTATIAETSSGSCGDNLTWELDDSGTLTISGTGEMADWNYDSDGGSPWADYAEQIKAIVIGDGVTSISGTFDECYNLTSVVIGNGVKTIDDYAFWDCEKLESVTFGNSVTTIGMSAFQYCISLTSIALPDSVTTIDSLAFHNCTKLTKIEIGTGVTSIGNLALGYYEGEEYEEYEDENGDIWYDVTYVNALVDGVTIYGYTDTAAKDYATKNGIDFVAVDGGDSGGDDGDDETTVIASGTCGVDGDNLTWVLDDSGTLTISGTGEMEDCEDSEGDYCAPWRKYRTSIISVVIEDGVTSIGESAFEECTSLTGVTIGNSVTSIGNYAFYGCTGLTSVIIPDSVTSIGYSAFEECTSLTSVTIGNSVTSIGNYAFYGCTGLTSVIIPDSVTSIGYSAFQKCTSLTSVTIGNSVTDIDGYAFYGCTSLTSVTIGKGLTSIGDFAFDGCTSLTDINVDAGNTVYSSSDGVLFDKAQSTLICCPQGKTGTYTIPDNVTSIGSYAFYGCTGLTSVTIPDSVTSIGSYAFYGCTGLTSVTIPDSVTSIGDGAFHGTPWLDAQGDFAIVNGILLAYQGTDSNVTIPDSVTSIGGSAFSGCSSLTSVTIPDSVTSIGDNAFKDCTSLTSVTIPDSVVSIGNVAFFNCCSLKRIVIPDSVISIGDSGFAYCDSLTSVTIPDSVTSIGSYAFGHCTSLTSVTIGNGVTSIGGWAFSYCDSLTRVTIGNGVTSIGDGAFNECGLTNVYYGGTEDDWTAIEIGGYNNVLTNATIHYNNATEHTHTYSAPTWTWSGTSAATATFICTEGDDTQTVTATVTSETTAATYTAAGKTVYTATVTFNGETYTDTQTVTIAKLTLAVPAVTLSNTSSGVKISWGAVTGADRYRVYRKASGDSSWTTLGYTTSTSYTDADAVSGTTYYYTVRAYCGSAYSSYSSKTIIRLAQPTVSLSNTSSGVKISWGKVTGATTYKVYRKTSSSSSFSRIATISSGSTVTYTDTTAKSGTTYYYTVQAYNGSYKSSYVSNKTIVRLAQPTVSLSNTSSGVKVSWGAVTGATKYRVYRKASGATSWTTVKSSTTSTSYTDTAVKSKNGTTYYYAVRAYSGSYSSSYVTNKSIVRLTTPTLSSVTNSASKKMTVKWTKVSGVTGYQIQYSTSSSFSSYTTVKVTGASSVSKVISSLTKGKTYYVRIRTYKTVSGTNYYSGWSSKKSVKISK